MTTDINIQVVESVVRSFKGEQFTMDQFKFAMAAQYPPVRRVQSSAAAHIMRCYGLAKAGDKICIPVQNTHRMTTVWRPLVGGI